MIKEGANVMDILNKYREAVPDIHDRLEREVANLGYKVQEIGRASCRERV